MARAYVSWVCLLVWTVVCCGVLVSSQTSYSVSSYHSEHFGPDGIITGRSGYKDSTGHSRFTKYQVGKDGKRRLIADDQEGDIESRSLLPDPSKLPGIPGFDTFGNPEAFFRSLGIPKEALLPPLFPRDLLPPSLFSENGGFEKSHKPSYRPTSLEIPKEALLPPFFPRDLLPPSLFSENGGFGKSHTPSYRPT